MKRILQLRYGVRLVWDSGPGWFLASCAIVVLQGLLPLASLYLLKQIVDSIIAALPDAAQPGALRRAFVYVALAALMELLDAACRALAAVISENQSQAVADHVQEEIQRQSAALDLAFYETPAYQDTLHRAQQDARSTPLRIVNAMTRVAVNLISLVGLAAILFTFHWGITLVLCLAMFPGFLYALRVSRRMFDWRNACTEMERKTFYLHWVLTSGIHAMENKCFGFAGALIARFKSLRLRLRHERLAWLKRQMAGELLGQGGGLLVVFGCLLFMAAQTAHGRITVGSLVMFLQAMRRAEGYFRSLMQSLAALYEDSLFLKNIRDLLEMEPTIRPPDRPARLPATGAESFRLAGVDFRYPGTDVPALRDVAMELRPGQRVALVGHNGSGKSTLVKLLCRLYDPDAGRVEYGGVEIRSFAPADYRRLIGVMFQNFTRYAFPARDNIWLGNVALDPHDPRIEAAACLADADRLIRGLPQGYDTQLGRGFKAGAEISQGEWQKIALARAFVSDARLLVLDEPSSFLDSDAEEQLFANLKEFARRKTILFVSHRFSTVRQADWIYVMEDGLVKEQGDHATLLGQNGLYARMFQLQARGYQTDG